MISFYLQLWHKQSADATSALMRVGIGIILIYRLIVLSMDLKLGYISLLPNATTGINWKINLLHQQTSHFLVWTIYLLALLIAICFLLGLVTWLTGPLSLFFHLLFMSYQSAMVTSFDGLLTVALLYVGFMPCARYLSLVPRRGLAISVGRNHLSNRKNVPLVWGGMMMRALQIHLCLLYLHSALLLLTTDFAFGEVFWHPLQTQKTDLVQVSNWADNAQVTWLINSPKLMIIGIGLLLFQFVHPILVWIPKIRYATLIVAVVVHLGTGIILHTLLFNLLMLLLNMSFVSEKLNKKFLDYIRLLLALPYVR